MSTLKLYCTVKWIRNLVFNVYYSNNLQVIWLMFTWGCHISGIMSGESISLRVIQTSGNLKI